MKREKENKIVLGTAQFSNNYGVTNKEFLNDYKIRKILQESLKFRIKTIDTAPNYKGVEKKLGMFNLKSFKLITKVSLKKNNKTLSSNNLNQNIKNSLSTLNIEEHRGF